MKLLQSAAFAVAAFATTTLSALQTFTPISGGPSYSIGVPSSSSISSTSNGDVFIQLRAPAQYTFAAFGIGEEMAGARIFVMYSDGTGNVTVSARRGQGHVQPQNDATLQRGVTLLAGSGVSGGFMTANIKVSSTTLQSDKLSTASNFIAAWVPGAPLDSTSTSATIRQHGGNAYRQFTLDLSKAVLTTTDNPFTQSSNTVTTTNPTATSSPKSGDDDDDDDSNGGATVIGSNGDELATYRKAHGIVMSVAVVLLFPLGAVFIRLGGSMWGHVAVQMSALISLAAGFGLGIKLGGLTDLLFNNPHTIIGATVFGLFLLQPLFGIAHHLQYRKHSTRTPISHVHIWYGRAILILGIINGGLGLKLAANTKTGEIVYGAVAGVVMLVYFGLAFGWRKGRGRQRVKEEGSEEIRLRNVRGEREKRYGA